ncbi:N-acetyltransferase [Ceratobasidium sp. AG-Ba]|nr:N-acetyltransferase [Ceratobasidium sp. AG-Ba]
MPLPDGFFVDTVRPDEVEAAHALEADGYPADEAASLEALRYRQSVAPDLFLGAYVPTPTPRTLIGFVVATLSPSPTLTHHSMETHEPTPTPSSVCIHSVCVSKSHLRQGVALKLLEEYLKRLEGIPTVARVLLICKENLKPLYSRAGFTEVGPSSVVHGQDQWYEFKKDIEHSPAQPSQASILAALQSQSSRPKRPQVSYSCFSSPATDLTYTDPGDPTQYNTHKLTCPRDVCGSLILSRGVGVWHSAPPSIPEIFSKSVPGFNDPDQSSGWWLVTPSPMQFENIGFSKAVEGGIKYLSCAECDLGPLGWCVEKGPSEFWLNASRVGYRTA